MVPLAHDERLREEHPRHADEREGEEEELDREMGDLGDDQQVVDEKMWGEDEEDDEGEGDVGAEAAAELMRCSARRQQALAQYWPPSRSRPRRRGRELTTAAPLRSLRCFPNSCGSSQGQIKTKYSFREKLEL